jgi:uncharacterized membrane protein
VIGSSNRSNAVFVCAAIGVFGTLAGTFGKTIVFEGLFKGLRDRRKASLFEDAIAILLGFLVLIPIY